MVKPEKKLLFPLSYNEIILYQRIKFFEGRRVIFTVNIPFICQNCGKCCRIIGFPVGCAHLNEIGNFLGIDTDSVVKMLRGDSNNSHGFKNLKPCIFHKNNRCSIYPVRPSACRYFPLMMEFKDYGIGCRGLERIREVEEVITEGYEDFISRNKFVSLDTVENVKVKVPASIVRRFMSTNPSESEVKMFFKLNDIKSNSIPFI